MRIIELEPGFAVEVDETTVQDTDDPGYVSVMMDAGTEARLTILRSLWSTQ